MHNFCAGNAFDFQLPPVSPEPLLLSSVSVSSQIALKPDTASSVRLKNEFLMNSMPRFTGFLVALLVVTTTHALTVRPPSFRELVGAADTVVAGEVTHIECVPQTVDGRQVPLTLVTIRVTDTLKGPAVPIVVLECLGGTIGNKSLKVVGVPEFVIGDRGFFFVQNNGTQFFPLVGVTHGVYWTVREEQSGTEVVTRDDGQPLTSTEQVGDPLRQRSLSLRQTAAVRSQDALTPAQFSERIKAEVAHASR